VYVIVVGYSICCKLFAECPTCVWRPFWWCCLVCSDRYGKTAVELAFHPAMKDALRTPIIPHKVLSQTLTVLSVDW